MKTNVKIKNENNSSKTVRKHEQEKGSDSDKWSDGERRIVDELFTRDHYVRYCLKTGEQIIFRQNIPIPRIGDVLKIKLLDGSDELNFLKKLLKCKVVIEYQFSQAFNFTVKSVECEITNIDEDAPEYIVIMEPIAGVQEFKVIHI